MARRVDAGAAGTTISPEATISGPAATAAATTTETAAIRGTLTASGNFAGTFPVTESTGTGTLIGGNFASGNFPAPKAEIIGTVGET